eukprot:gene10780-17799_t
MQILHWHRPLTSKSGGHRPPTGPPLWHGPSHPHGAHGPHSNHTPGPTCDNVHAHKLNRFRQPCCLAASSSSGSGGGTGGGHDGGDIEKGTRPQPNAHAEFPRAQPREEHRSRGAPHARVLTSMIKYSESHGGDWDEDEDDWDDDNEDDKDEHKDEEEGHQEVHNKDSKNCQEEHEAAKTNPSENSEEGHQEGHKEDHEKGQEERRKEGRTSATSMNLKEGHEQVQEQVPHKVYKEDDTEEREAGETQLGSLRSGKEGTRLNHPVLSEEVHEHGQEEGHEAADAKPSSMRSGMDTTHVYHLVLNASEMDVADTLLACLMDETVKHMMAFRWRELSNILWALATLHRHPGYAWVELALDVTVNKLTFWRSDPQSLSNSAWALARLGVTPDKNWMARFRAAVLDRAYKRKLLPQHLSTILYSVSVMDLYKPPPDYWMQRYVDVLTSALKLTAISNRAALLGESPTEASARSMWQGNTVAPASSSGQHGNRLAERSSSMQYGNRLPEWSSSMQYGNRVAERSSSMQHGNRLAEQSSSMQYGNRVAERSSSAQYDNKPAASSWATRQGSTVAASSRGRNQGSPMALTPQEFEDQWVAILQQCANPSVFVRFDAQQHCNALHALAKLGYDPGEGYWRVFLLSSATLLSRQCLLHMAQDPAQPGPEDQAIKSSRPGPEDQVPMDQDQAKRGPRRKPSGGTHRGEGGVPPRAPPMPPAHFTASHLAGMLWSMSRLQQRPPGSWMRLYQEALLPQLRYCTVKELCIILSAYGKVSYTPRRRILRPIQWWLWCRRHLLTPVGVCLVLVSLARLNKPPGQAWVTAVLRSSLENAPAPATAKAPVPASFGLTAHAAVSILCSLGALDTDPGPQLMGQLLGALKGTSASSISQEALQEVVAACITLGYDWRGYISTDSALVS